MGKIRSARLLIANSGARLTESEITHVSLWRTRAVELVRRPVSVAMFDGGGPPEFAGAVSSHFKDDDWRVTRDG